MPHITLCKSSFALPYSPQRYIEWLELDGTSKFKPSAVATPTKSGTRSGYPGPQPAWTWTPPGMGRLQLLWATCYSTSPLSVEIFPLTSYLNVPSFSLKLFFLILLPLSRWQFPPLSKTEAGRIKWLCSCYLPTAIVTKRNMHQLQTNKVVTSL